MVDVPASPIELPSSWRAADCAARTDWLHTLSDGEIAEIDAALGHVASRGLKVLEFGRDDFPLPGLAARMGDTLALLEDGPGLAVIRGLPVERYSMDQAAAIFWGIGCHLGQPHCQTPTGDYLCHVRDAGGDQYHDPTVRSQRTRKRLNFHNDQVDAVALLCLNTAKSGGLSRIASAVSVHNEILKRRPDLLRLLYGEFHSDVRGEEPEGRKPYFTEPRFAIFQDRFYVHHGRAYLQSGQRYPEVPRLTEAQIEALDLIDELAESDAFRLDFDFRPGDMQFLNNHLMLHARTAYEDHDEATRKRHLLRLWLRTPGYRQLPPYLDRRFEYFETWSRNGPRVEALG